MRRPFGSRAAGVLFTVLAAGSMLVPAPAAAQVSVGVHGVHAADAFGGATGAGLRAGLDIGLLPFAVFASAEKFFPDCPSGSSGCSLAGFTLDANFRMTIPVVRPYVTGGLVWRDFSVGGEDGFDDSASGVALGVGADVRLGQVGVFGEGRYEFLKAPERQYVFRLGVLFNPF